MSHADYDPEAAYEQAQREAVDRAYANAEPAPADHPDDVSANARRAARLEEQRELAALRRELDETRDRLTVALSPNHVHAQPVKRNHLGYTLACGKCVGREQYGTRNEPRIVTTRIGDAVTCPVCKMHEEVVEARELAADYLAERNAAMDAADRKTNEVTSLLAVNDVLRAERDALRAEREERAA